jgi:hypothetical protein
VAGCLADGRDVDHPFGKLEVFLWRELSGGSDQFLVRTFTHHRRRRQACIPAKKGITWCHHEARTICA